MEKTNKMEIDEVKKLIVFMMEKFFLIIVPWKINTSNEEYNRGWNDCLKEIKKRRKKLIKDIKEKLNL